MAGTRAMGAKLSYTDEGKKYIAHLTSLGAVKISNAENEVTTHDSPGGAKEFDAGDQSTDNLSFSGNVVKGDDSFKRLWALAKARTSKEFVAEYADGSKMTFTGYIASAEMGEQTTDGLMVFSGEIKVSGIPTLTPAV